MKRIFVCGLAALITCATVLQATGLWAEDADQQQDRRAVARAAATQQRRDWILRKMKARLDDPRRLADLEAKLSVMSAAEIEREAGRLFDQLVGHEQDRGQALLEMARRDQAGQPPAYVDEQTSSTAAAAPVGSPGFFPMIAWVPGMTLFPSGLSFTASAIILPGGDVRVTVFPYFGWSGFHGYDHWRWGGWGPR